MKSVALIQARLGSRRLPGKVLSPIAGRPLLAYMIERVRCAKRLDLMIVATSTARADDPVAALCHSLGVPVVRGSEDDVLDRMLQAARQAEADEVIRLTADCPLIDPALIDAVIDLRRAEAAEYASNSLPPTFPDGLDVEAMTRTAIETAAAEATLPSDREHVTPYIRNRPDRFRHANLTAPADFSHLRWTVDEAADLALVERIAGGLARGGGTTGWLDVLAEVTRYPDLLTLNRHISRNEGYSVSLAQDLTQGLDNG